jgi:hypothetical protein
MLFSILYSCCTGLAKINRHHLISFVPRLVDNQFVRIGFLFILVSKTIFTIFERDTHAVTEDEIFKTVEVEVAGVHRLEMPENVKVCK